jgi:hypothetical protein
MTARAVALEVALTTPNRNGAGLLPSVPTIRPGSPSNLPVSRAARRLTVASVRTTITWVS